MAPELRSADCKARVGFFLFTLLLHPPGGDSHVRKVQLQLSEEFMG